MQTRLSDRHASRGSPGRCALAVVVACGLAWPAAGVASQSGLPGAAPQADTTGPAAGPTTEASDSPRAAMRQFLELAGQGDYERAARFLQLDRRSAARGPELAQRVHRFIQRRVLIDLDSISSLPAGDQADGEPDHDHVGRMYVGVNRFVEPIGLARVREGGQSRWVIDRQTIAQLDAAYAAAVDSSWTTGRLPPSLTVPGPLGIPRWKWVLGILGLPLVWLLTLALGYALRSATLVVARRTRATWDDELVTRMRGPLRLFVASVLAHALPLLLELDAATISGTFRVLRAVAVVAMFWALLRIIGLAQDHLARKAWASDHTSARTIVPLVGRSLRVGLGLAALLVAISQFGYPVGTVLAGLGLGGLVVALAAQKTVENLFGSVSLAADRVFRVGDWVRVDDVQGTVERIGLRSTHLRTLDRTLVKIPNGRLAEARIESFGERDRIRFFMTLQLDPGTTAAQLREVLRGIEALLREHPRAWPEGVAVRLVALGPQSLDLTVNAWFVTTNFGEFEVIRQEMLLGIMDAVEQAGARLALPKQIMRVERGAGDGARDGAAVAVETEP